MSQQLRLLPVDELQPGESREVVAEGRIFAVFNVDGQFHVLDGVCPHAGGPLGKGMLHEGVVTCPWHGWQFDVRTGQHCLNENLCHTSYKTEVIGGEITVELG